MRLLILCAAAMCFAGQARAEDCDVRLFKSTVQYQSDEITNLSLAWTLTEGAYNLAKREMGGSAIIYGVPVIASAKAKMR
jgi:hypothetical protein